MQLWHRWAASPHGWAFSEMRWSKLGKNPPPIGLLESALRDRLGGLSSGVELDAERSDAQSLGWRGNPRQFFISLSAFE